MWNYRVIMRTYTNKDSSVDNLFGIHEVYYTKKHEVDMWTEKPVDAFGTTLEELRKCYDLQAEAFTAPVLIETELLANIKKKSKTRQKNT
jgi:hypothetical protein